MSTLPTPQPVVRTAVAVERAQRAGLGARLVARWRTWSLDLALARGADPASSPALAARAAALVRPAARRRLAQSTLGAIADAHEQRVDQTLVLVARRAVRGAEPALRALAEALAGDAPVAARGVARVRLLLTDGQGPLYRDQGADELVRAANSARLALLI
jgi:hypothetical protein